MSFFSKHFGIRLDGHSLGNLLKNVSPALAFTPLGLTGVAGASALGDLGRGKRDVGGILRGAVGNVAIGAGGHALAGKAGLLHSASGVSTAAPGGALDLPTPTPSITAGAPGASATNAIPAAAHSLPGVVAPTPPPPPGFFSKALGFVDKHPTAVGAGLQGIGGLATAGSENRINEANARLLEQKLGESNYDFQQRKARDLALEPLRRALAEQIGSGLGATQIPVAKNPYLPGA